MDELFKGVTTLRRESSLEDRKSSSPLEGKRLGCNQGINMRGYRTLRKEG